MKQTIMIFIGAFLCTNFFAVFASANHSTETCDPSSFTMAVKSPRGMSVIDQPLKPGVPTTFSIPRVPKGVVDQSSTVILTGKGVSNCTITKIDGDVSIGSCWGSENKMNIALAVRHSEKQDGEIEVIIGPRVGKWGKPVFKQFIVHQQ